MLPHRPPSGFIPLLTIAILALIAGLCGLAGCERPSGIETSTFIWDTERPVPRWREDSPIEWYGTHQQAEVIEESRSTGKPILCYVSRYDESYRSGTIESALLTSDSWSQVIAEHFVAWEVNFWEDPALALQIATGGAGALKKSPLDPPCLAVLKPSEREGAGLLNVVELWDDHDFYFFPAPNPDRSDIAGRAHDMLLGVDDEEVQSELDRIAEDEGIPLTTVSARFRLGWEYDTLVDYLDMFKEHLGAGRHPADYCLWLSFAELRTGEQISELDQEISAWKINKQLMASEDMFDTALLMGPGFWYLSYTSLASQFYIPQNIMAMISANANDVDYPVAPGDLFRELYSMVVSDDGAFQGGFPAYLDSHRSREEYRASFPDPSQAVVPAEPLQLYPGPQDIVWVNARVLSMWLKLVMVAPELKATILPNGQTAGDFLDTLAPTLLGSLEEKAKVENPDRMLLMDRIYLLDLYNAMYQMTANATLLAKARAIAATFPHDATENWFEHTSVPLYPELILALHHYGWLAEDEDARASARTLSEEALGYMDPITVISEEAIRFFLAYETVNDKCIHVAVLASLDDPAGRELLEAALEGWDPRKIAQILDPERDAELIERKGYIAMDEAVAFVCIDDMCYPPVRDPDELREVIQEVQADLAAEREK